MSKSIYRIGDEADRPLSSVTSDAPPILQALRYGVTAPSAHNTQPWRIEVTSDTEAQVFFDPARTLPATDPPGRQVHISHGTLAEMTAIAATSLGWRADIDVLPDGEMSWSAFGTKPTFAIRLHREDGCDEDPLFERVLHRRSSRLPHDGRPLNSEERATIAEAKTIDGVHVDWITEASLERVKDLVAKAMRVEVEDHDLYDETRIWFRFSEEEIAEKGDGLHADTAGMSGIALVLARWTVRNGTWHAAYNKAPYMKGFEKAARSTSAFLTLTTATNTMRDWIETGRAYVRCQLAADAAGLRFQPTSQLLQEYPQMDALRAELNEVVGVSEPAKIQMLVRVGRTAQPALSPRRDLSTVVTQSD